MAQTELRKKKNKLMRLIKKRLRVLKEKEAENIASEISNTDNSRRMFEAVRHRKLSSNKSEVVVHDSDNSIIGCKSEKAKVVKQCFEKHYMR